MNRITDKHLDAPEGRREGGSMSTTRIEVPKSADQWSERVGPYQFRIWPLHTTLRLWRKEFNEAFYGGYQIKTIPVGTRIASEWLEVLK